MPIKMMCKGDINLKKGLRLIRNIYLNEITRAFKLRCRPSIWLTPSCFCNSVASPPVCTLSLHELCSDSYPQCSLLSRFFCVFTQIPDSMLDGNGTELVLGACPQLTSLTFGFHSDSIFITSLALDLPSLERLTLSSSPSLETLRLTCPNLVNIGMYSCPRLSVPPTWMARLTRFSGDVSLFFVVIYSNRMHEWNTVYSVVCVGLVTHHVCCSL